MSLGACIPDLVAKGDLTPEEGAEIGGLFEELQQDFRRQFGDQAADAMATDATLAALQRQATRKRFLAAQAIKAQQRIDVDMRGYNGGGGDGGGGDGPINPNAGPALIDHDPRARYSNVEGRRKAVRGRAHAMMDQILSDHSANMIGRVRKKAQLTDIVRELFDGDSGNHAARELADAWRQTAEMLRRRFNAAGGDIGYRSDWGLPQSHDWKAVRAAGYQAWRGAIWDKLDRAKMIDSRTGRPFSDEALELQLRDTFEAIRSNGWSRRTPGSGAGKSSLANSRADARFLSFKSADDWMAYADQFGQGTAFDAMMAHVDGMARDIAAMEILGPNPDATLRRVKDLLERSAALDDAPGSKAINKAQSAGKTIDDLYDEYRGALNQPRNEKMALVFSSIRSLQTAAKLGSATLSATSDFGFQAARRSFNGLPQTTVMRDYVKMMRPGSLEDQRLAVRRGLIADEWAGRTSAQDRYLSEELTGEIPRRLAEGVLRVSLLSRHTQAMRWVYGMESLATYTEQAGKSYDALEGPLRAALGRYGIGAGDWDKLRLAPMETDRGVEWIAPHNAGDEDLASRFMEMILEETDIAVPVADLRTRAYFNKLGGGRGTIGGEIIRSGLLFKSFGVSVLVRQSQEMMAMGAGNAAYYAAGLVTTTTLLGGLSILLKDIAAGRDPRAANDVPFLDDQTGEAEWSAGFWGQALLQGGGFGIFGDFLRSSTENRFGGGIAETLAGPLAQDFDNLTAIAKSNNPQGQALKSIKSMMPGQSLWYARLAFDRLMTDQIQMAIDPNYAKSWSRIERYAAEQGTQFYWEPGDPLPGRGVDFENALAEAPDND